MALTRLASALLASALAAGCNQSLFDANLGGGTGDGGTSIPDARNDQRDGGDDERDGGDDERDAAPDGPDARVVDAGPSPPPLYVEVYEGSGGPQRLLMESGTWNGLEAWVDPDTGVRSAIVNCPAHPDSEFCAGLPEGALLFVSTNDTHRPALHWTSPFRKVVVDFQWVVSESALTAPPASLRILQNGTVIYTETVELVGQPSAKLVPVDAGDDDVFEVIPAAGDPAGGRIGMRVNFNERFTLAGPPR